MGKVVKPIAKTLGIGGEQGEHFQAVNTNDAMGLINQRNNVMTRESLQDAFRNYGTGKMSLADALTEVGNTPAGAQRDEAHNLLAIDPLAGTQFATDQVERNEILGRMYGSQPDSALSRAIADEQELSSRGFSLQPEDHEAYGQAMGNITRQFGARENNLTQALASRGLASAPNGAAQVQFSGLMGNKDEQLAQSQMDIAQRRMQSNLERLNSARSNMATMGAQANGAIQDQFNRQMAGVQQKRSQLDAAAERQVMQNNAANNANLAAMQDKRGAKGATLGQAFGAGLLSSATAIGAAPGTAAQSFAGASGEGSGYKSSGYTPPKR